MNFIQKSQLTLIAALFATSGFSQVAVTTNFNTGFFNTNQGWVSGSFLQGQNVNDPVGQRWQGNDPEVGVVGGTDYLTLVFGYTPSGSGNRSLVQGGLNAFDGYVPGTNDVRLWRSFAPTASTLLDTVTYFVEWSLVGSLNLDYPEDDTFAFDLRTADNSQSLVRFDLTPGINILPNAYTLQSVHNSSTNDIIDLAYQGVYQMQVDITGSTYDLQISQINASTRAVLTNWSLVSGGALSGSLTALDFGTVGLDWELASGNPNDPGSNYIVVNQFAVSTAAEVIPEPATWIVGTLLLTGVAGRIYRRHCAANNLRRNTAA